jgi:hypothetical protein
MIFIDLEKAYDKILEISYGRHLKRNESQQITLPLLMICIQML